jgi:hypothetical protein
VGESIEVFLQFFFLLHLLNIDRVVGVSVGRVEQIEIRDEVRFLIAVLRFATVCWLDWCLVLALVVGFYQ